mmetsp:Transcript_10633/g.29327  ORF Transcript_10633/g.29327 Transcript_10633/m.29327 type:complete len:189 (+) Transcript_10633:386-952(+)
MTRAFTPPDTLSKSDIRTLGDVRRDIWTNSFQGIAFGTGSGFVLHTTAQLMKRFGLFPNAKLGRNTFMMSVLGGGALGSFLFALKAGKEGVHNLHPIFEVGSKPQTTVYEAAKERASTSQREQSDETDITRFGGDDANVASTNDDMSASEMQKMRTVRRKTLMDTIHNGQGLSDSHGGHWVQSNQDGK